MKIESKQAIRELLVVMAIVFTVQYIGRFISDSFLSGWLCGLIALIIFKEIKE